MASTGADVNDAGREEPPGDATTSFARQEWLSMRIVARCLTLFLAAYGPLAPITLLFLLVAPPLIAFSGWPWWLDLSLALGECAL
jgi:hypothetical protein